MYDTYNAIQIILIMVVEEGQPRSKQFAIVFDAFGLTSNERAPSEVQARANLSIVRAVVPPGHLPPTTMFQ